MNADVIRALYHGMAVRGEKRKKSLCIFSCDGSVVFADRMYQQGSKESVKRCTVQMDEVLILSRLH